MNYFTGFLVLFIAAISGLIYAFYTLKDYKKQIQELEEQHKKDQEALRTFDVDTMLKLGYGVLKEENFDKNDSVLFGQLFKVYNLQKKHKINFNYKHLSVHIERFLFETADRKFPIYKINVNNKKYKVFAWEINKITDLLNKI